MNIHNRKSIRLSEYDYSKYGYYFVTICTQNQKCIFGNISNNQMVLNNIGKMIKTNLGILTKRFPIMLNIYQIMPNHIHLIVVTNIRATTRVAPTNSKTLGEIIGAFKSITTDEYINGVKNNHWPPFNKRLWQRNYYEHIVRNELELNKIREYIKSNPQRWERDRNNPIIG